MNNNISNAIAEIKRINPDLTEKGINAGLLDGVIYNLKMVRDDLNGTITLLENVADYLKEQD